MSIEIEGGGALTAKQERLGVYHNDYEWVIAYSPADAVKVCQEATGYEPDLRDGPPEDSWSEEIPDGKLKIWCGPDGKVCGIGEGTLVELTHREWCAKFGRSYLACTEG